VGQGHVTVRIIYSPYIYIRKFYHVTEYIYGEYIILFQYATQGESGPLDKATYGWQTRTRK
jgi:hypothetical protein